MSPTTVVAAERLGVPFARARQSGAVADRARLNSSAATTGEPTVDSRASANRGEIVELLTATDLDDWSGRRDAQAHLPTLVRRLIMATVIPNSVRISAAEGVGSPGFDGVLEVPVGAAPFVPAGRSVWEMGTGRSPERKAAADYKKRTDETPAVERSTTTFVFVSSRPWDGAPAWAKSKNESSDGWANVLALDAQDLATWLETCPGVHGWLVQ
jgi:hypothetical protein